MRALLAGHTVATPAGTRPLTSADLAVVTAHVTQASAVRALLADLPDVLVGTANQIQGLERPAVVALHPAAGYRDLSAAFGTDPGRACVMLSRHRAHLTVVTDTITPGVLAAARGTAAATQAALLDRLLGHSRRLIAGSPGPSGAGPAPCPLDRRRPPASALLRPLHLIDSTHAHGRQLRRKEARWLCMSC